jgi:two-component system, response regulator, stage 0 sporulation protein F
MPRLLIVEDDASLRKLYEDEFREDGYTVTSVSSGEEAMERIRQSPPEAVVLDIRLGGMNGLDVLRSVLLDRPTIAVVLNSAYPTYKQHFASWSADGYVVKSSDLTELKSAVATALQHRLRTAA